MLLILNSCPTIDCTPPCKHLSPYISLHASIIQPYISSHLKSIWFNSCLYQLYEQSTCIRHPFNRSLVPYLQLYSKKWYGRSSPPHIGVPTLSPYSHILRNVINSELATCFSTGCVLYGSLLGPTLWDINSIFCCPDTNVSELNEVVVLKAEISRLQEQLKDVEKQNKFLNEKLTQQQWDMDHRLAEIEMQICRDTSSVGSSIDENERNRESVI